MSRPAQSCGQVPLTSWSARVPPGKVDDQVGGCVGRQADAAVGGDLDDGEIGGRDLAVVDIGDERVGPARVGPDVPGAVGPGGVTLSTTDVASTGTPAAPATLRATSPPGSRVPGVPRVSRIRAGSGALNAAPGLVMGRANHFVARRVSRPPERRVKWQGATDHARRAPPRCGRPNVSRRPCSLPAPLR
jgi:hypothetical protein